MRGNHPGSGCGLRREDGAQRRSRNRQRRRRPRSPTSTSPICTRAAWTPISSVESKPAAREAKEREMAEALTAGLGKLIPAQISRRLSYLPQNFMIYLLKFHFKNKNSFLLNFQEQFILKNNKYF